MCKVLLIAVCACGVVAAADAPYAGTWKMNIAKSNFGDSTMTYEQLSSGEMKITVDGQSYNVKFDGTDHRTPWGVTEAWISVDAHTWELIEKTDGKLTSTSVLRLAINGKTLTLDARRLKADGSGAAVSLTFQRIAGGVGLAGKWRTRKLHTDSPESMTLAPNGSEGLAIAMGNEGAVCDAKFDGKDYPATGPVWPSGWTCAISHKEMRGFDVTWKKDGREMYRDKMTVSADGLTLTETGSPTGTNEKVTIVWDKKSGTPDI